MAKDYSADFLEEMRLDENRPFLIAEIFLGEDRGVFRITSLDERLEISYDDPEFLKEP